MKKSPLPIIIFVATLLFGVIVLLISENIQFNKIKTTPRADANCPDRVNTRNCGGGTCTITKKYYFDPLDSGGCILESEEQTGTCSECDQTTSTPAPTATGTPPPSSTPTATGTPPPSSTPTSTPTNTPTPTATNTPSPTPTQIPSACGAPTCDNTTNPCNAGLICVQANNGQNYCSRPELQAACKQSPTVGSCCSAATATPTEIILAKSSPSPTTSITPIVATVPAAGNIPWFLILAPATLLLLGLLF